MVAEVNGPNYKRDEFLTTLKSLKDSVDDNSKLEQTELKAIYDCLKESSTFLKKLANPGTSGADSDAAAAAAGVSDVSSTSVDASSNFFKPMITLLAGISDHTNHAAEEAFKIRNIMMGSSDISEAYEKNFGSQMGFSETKSIRDQLSSPGGDDVEDSKAKEDKNDEAAQQSKLGKMFSSMNGYLKDLVGKGKKIAKVGIIATLTALGLIWLLKFMETETWKDISSAVASFINTGLPIIVKTIDFIVGGVVGLFTAIKTVWDYTVGGLLNFIGKMFGVTRDVDEVDEKGNITGKKEVGFLGDGIGLLIVAFAGLALAAKATALAMSPMKTLGGAAKKIGGLFGGGGAKSVASSVTSAATGGSNSMSIPQMGSKSGGGWTSKLAGGAKNLGKGIADLGKGIGKGLGKLIELTLKGLAAGLKALGNSAVIKGAFAMGILGIAMIPFAIAVNKFSRANWKGLGIAVAGMGAMAAAAFALGKVAKHVLVGSAAMVLLGLAMIPLSHAMQKFSTIDWVSIPKGIAALVAFSVAVGVLGAAMMTGIGAVFFGAGVAAIAALGAGLLVFGAGAKSMAKGVDAIVPSISRLAKLDTKKLQKVEPALKAVAAGLWSFSKSSLGSTFLSWVGKLFGKNSPIDNIQRLAKSAPNISLLSYTLGKLGDQLRDFGKKASGFKADQIEEFIDAIDHDEAKDMLALGKMLESMSKVDFTGLSNVNLKNLELPKLEDKLVATYVKFFNKLMEVFDKWPNNFAWPGAVPMESAGTAPPIRRQPRAVPSPNYTVLKDGTIQPKVEKPAPYEGQSAADGGGLIKTKFGNITKKQMEMVEDQSRLGGDTSGKYKAELIRNAADQYRLDQSAEGQPKAVPSPAAPVAADLRKAKLLGGMRAGMGPTILGVTKVRTDGQEWLNDPKLVAKYLQMQIDQKAKFTPKMIAEDKEVVAIAEFRKKWEINNRDYDDKLQGKKGWKEEAAKLGLTQEVGHGPYKATVFKRAKIEDRSRMLDKKIDHSKLQLESLAMGGNYIGGMRSKNKYTKAASRKQYGTLHRRGEGMDKQKATLNKLQQLQSWGVDTTGAQGNVKIAYRETVGKNSITRRGAMTGNLNFVTRKAIADLYEKQVLQRAGVKESVVKPTPDLAPVDTSKVASVIPKTMANKVPTIKLSENAVKVTVPITTKGLPASVPANAQSIIEGKFGSPRNDIEYTGAVTKFAKEQGWIGTDTKAKFTGGQIVLPGLPLTDLQKATQKSKSSQNKVVRDGDKLEKKDWGDWTFIKGQSTRRPARQSQTGALVQSGTNGVATAQQVAGASSGVNIGGSTSTQVDNSRKETIHVGKSASSADTRMTSQKNTFY